ncbi:hypothetical protein KAZ93_01805 [Patescibacteria group bacterium]|nr:hypothetical protein [Patescibacteria group bacterium]
MKKAILFGGIIILCLSIYRQYRTQTTVTPTIVTHSVESTGGGYSGRVDEGISTTEIMPITGNDQKDLEILE